MATLAGQRATFTWALNQYNLAEDAQTRALNAKRMAKPIAAAPANGFTVEEVTQGQNYPVAEVQQCLDDPNLQSEPGISEQQAILTVREAVDTADVLRIGEGAGFVYAYGYRCLGDRLKVGSTQVDTIQRIAAQISTSTPDKPALFLEIRTDDCRRIEKAIQAVLEARSKKIDGGSVEWFTTSRDEILAIYKFIKQSE